MKHAIRTTVAALVAAAGLAAAAQAAAPPAEIIIPGERLITESLTSTADGTVIVGSMVGKTIFKAAPGSARAEVWIKPGTNGLQGIFGVFADEKSNTLYACSGNPPGPPQPGAAPSALHTFDLKSGAPKGRYELPTPGATCNDIAVDAAGNAYASDTGNSLVVVLKKGAGKLEVWAGADGSLGPKNSVIDGISVLGNQVLVNALASGKLYVAPIGKDGKAGAVTEVKLDRKLDGPDGMRSWGKALLVAEGQGKGKLSRIDFTSPDLTSAKVTTVKEGYPDGPVAVTVIGDMAYVLEGQLSLIMGPPGAAPAAPKPFHATSVHVGKAP